MLSRMGDLMVLVRPRFRSFGRAFSKVAAAMHGVVTAMGVLAVAAAMPTVAGAQQKERLIPTASEPPKPIVAASAAAIAAMLVQESRAAYHASGRSCACPDDLMRNGRRCGGNSAYSKPGGAAPYCYVSDVPPEVIQRVQSRLSP
jgi:hypothetical protein